MIANSVANFSQFERRLIGQRTKDALAVKRAQGVRLGRRPVMPAKVVRRIEGMRKKGVSIRGIADRLNEDGVPTAQGWERWHASSSMRRPPSSGAWSASTQPESANCRSRSRP